MFKNINSNINVTVKIDESKIKIPIKIMIGYMAYDGFLSKDKLVLKESKNKNGF